MLFRCPYCHETLPPPPWESAACPSCGRTMRTPSGTGARRNFQERRQALERIARDAERKRREFRFPAGAALGRQPAFLLVAVLALAFLGGALITMSRKVSQVPASYRRDVARDELAEIAQALGLYALHVGHYPTERDGDLVALVADPGHSGWSGPYLNRLQPDPWGRPYRYSDSTMPPTLLSHGPDRVLGTQDDLHADPADFEIRPELAATWSRSGPRNPTVEIGSPLQTP